MRRRAIALTYGLTVVLGSAVLLPANAPPGQAQGTPVASPAVGIPALRFSPPAGVTLRWLAGRDLAKAALAEDWGVDPEALEDPRYLMSVTLVLEKITLAAGATVGAVVGHLLYVEVGRVVVTPAGGGAYPPNDAGSQVSLSERVSVRNAGAELAVIYRIGLQPPQALGKRPITAGRAGVRRIEPIHDEQTPEPGVATQTLFSAPVETLPSDPMVLFLARTTWEPGAVFDGRAFNGTVGLTVESGDLLGPDPENVGQDMSIEKETFEVYRSGDPVRFRSVGQEPADVFLVGLVPADGDLATPTGGA